MAITKQDLDKAFAEFKSVNEGKREDYFGLLYLMREYGRSPDEAARSILLATRLRRA